MFLPVVVTSVVIVGLWMLWYNSGQHKLQRCVKAQSDHYYSTSEGQELHLTVRIRPLTCSSWNAIKWVSTDGSGRHRSASRTRATHSTRLNDSSNVIMPASTPASELLSTALRPKVTFGISSAAMPSRSLLNISVFVRFI